MFVDTYVTQIREDIFMLKKILIIAGASTAVLVGTLAFLKNSKMMKTRRAVKRISNAMYTVGTMLRTLSCQVSEV